MDGKRIHDLTMWRAIAFARNTHSTSASLRHVTRFELVGPTGEVFKDRQEVNLVDDDEWTEVDEDKAALVHGYVVVVIWLLSWTFFKLVATFKVFLQQTKSQST